jgi:glutathione peroxidase
MLSVSLVLSIFGAAQLVLSQKNHDNCDYWAEVGECQKNPNYMLKECKTSCDEVAAGNKASLSASSDTPRSFYEIKEKDISGKTVDFSQFTGKVVYVVNVASYCGYTESNYKILRDLSNYRAEGLEILVFPCNQFGAQEPGTGTEITNFAKSKGFNGIIMSKGDVNGDKTRPTFKFLKESTQKNYITWYDIV